MNTNELEKLYLCVKNEYKDYIEKYLNLLKTGKFSINIDNKTVKYLKIYSNEKWSLLSLRGIEFYKNSKILNISEADYVYKLYSKRTASSGTFTPNIIKDPVMIVSNKKPILVIKFPDGILIDKIILYTRIKEFKFYKFTNNVCVDISYDGKNYIPLFSVPSIFEADVKSISNSIFNKRIIDKKYEQIESVIRMIYAAMCENAYSFEEFMIKCNESGIDPLPIKEFINVKLLPQKMQITNLYGLQKTFRVWSEDEKKSYIESCISVINLLYLYTKNIFFCAGSLLGFIREFDHFIPHDVDIDLACVIHCNQYKTINSFKDDIIPFLTENGCEIRNVNQNFFKVSFKKSPYFDIIPGIEDNNGIVHFLSYNFPASMLYPTIPIQIYDYTLPIPRSPFELLETWYGKNWRIPIDSKNRKSLPWDC